MHLLYQHFKCHYFSLFCFKNQHILLINISLFQRPKYQSNSFRLEIEKNLIVNYVQIFSLTTPKTTQKTNLIENKIYRGNTSLIGVLFIDSKSILSHQEKIIFDKFLNEINKSNFFQPGKIIISFLKMFSIKKRKL
jgi:hypothetical protein